ncbi:MAG: uracil-DNA glycosylase [Thermoanaerobaculia bacterium]
MTKAISEYVDVLSRCAVPAHAHNQYAGRSRGAATRRENLSLYLAQMRRRRPTTILVGEAPSHRGCRLTGIPFMSETLMLRGVEPPGLFGSTRNYRRATRGERTSTEASATIVWATIATVDPTPLLWNAFPFHPHRPGEPRSNRPPTALELEIGQGFLVALIGMFDVTTVVAVGNRARDSLSSLGIEHTRVRHPSRGGKRDFAAGIAELCQNSAKGIVGGPR